MLLDHAELASSLGLLHPRKTVVLDHAIPELHERSTAARRELDQPLGNSTQSKPRRGYATYRLIGMSMSAMW